MSYRCLLTVAHVGVIVMLYAPVAAALEVRVAQVRVVGSRVTATFELRDLLRDRFLELVEQGRAVFLQCRAELWEDRRVVDRLALNTPTLTYRIDSDAGRTVVITDQYGNHSARTDVLTPLSLRLDIGPASGLVDDRSYYLRAQVTAASVADREIDQWGSAIFGDDQGAAGLASLGRFVFRTLLRIGKYLESANAEVTSGRYTGLQIRAGVT